jgi:hypothetical protein
MRRQTGPATDEIGMRRKLSFYFSRQPLVVRHWSLAIQILALTNGCPPGYPDARLSPGIPPSAAAC